MWTLYNSTASLSVAISALAWMSILLNLVKRWRDVLEKHGLNISRQKTEYTPPSNTNDTVKLGEEETPSNTLAPYWGLRDDKKEIARTEFDCHAVNGEKRRVLFEIRKCR